eukprot:TRINITY_DN3618_c0_g1_i1.p1 TRINITY_DN3618_c0_g1~~TRINITY_DN3618_c0_g1_i1.p1  ORF type:complete len:216 (+),score=51.92 TRINITY_DN3618_c0_g1_i1:365-1012(+)
MAEPESYLCKVLVVGAKATGKTCLIRRYTTNSFSNATKPTLGVDFAVKDIPISDSINLSLQIWDIAGQERYESMTRSYYQAAVGALVVYDRTREATWESACKWKEDIDKKVTLPDGQPIPCVLVANKCDLEAKPPRSGEELDAFCKEHRFVGWIETSSKENTNVEECFQLLVQKVREKDIWISKNPAQSDPAPRRKPCCGGAAKEENPLKLRQSR